MNIFKFMGSPESQLFMAAPTVSQGARDRTSYAQMSAPLIGREKVQFEEKIALEAKYKAPLTLMTMKLNRGSSNTIDVHWWEDQYLPVRDGVNYSTGYNSSATDITVDHGEYFAVGDLVRDMNTDEVMLVTSISSDVLTVTRDFGQSTEGWTAKADSIVDDDYLEIIGNTFEPGHPLPSSKHTIDVEKINYCQDFRTPIEITEVSEDTILQAEQDLPYQLRKNNNEHWWKIELQNLWGKPYRSDKGKYVAATGNTAPAQAGGINHYIEYYADSDHKVDQTDLTEWEFMDFLEVGMDKGSREKVLVCPGNLCSAFSKWGITRENTFERTTVLGMVIYRWQVWGGEITILAHDMLKRPSSSYYYYAFLLDMEQLKWMTFGRNGSTRLRNAGNHETTGETKTSKEYETIACLEVKQPNYHARLRYKTYSV